MYLWKDSLHPCDALCVMRNCEGTELFQVNFAYSWIFDTIIKGIGNNESGGGTLGVLRNEGGAPFTGHLMLAGDATITSAGSLTNTITSYVDVTPTLTIGATYRNGSLERNMIISGGVGQFGMPISLLMRHHTTTLTGTGYCDALGIS